MVFLVSGGWLGWKFYRNAAKITHDNNPLHLLSVFKPVPLKSQNGRVNILVAGDSVDRTDGGGGGDLTDSIMVLSIDTKNHTAFMLSIPRDTWTPLPPNKGLGTHQKINAAHEITTFDESGYPKGGMGALEYVIKQDFNIPIDYYALVNYTAFKDLVDAVGGITIDIESPNPKGLYDPQPFPGSRSFKLPNGVQTLNGTQALNLARARGDAYGSYGFPQGDFDRTQHQRQMVLAIKDKVMTASVISNPLKIGQLLDAVGNNVTTDMQLDEIESLYALTKNINDAAIQSVNINNLNGGSTTMLANYATPNGQSALIPAAGIDNFTQIQTAIAKLFSDNPLVKESASVVLLNGGNLIGLARAESQVLSTKGVTVSAAADASATIASNEIIDNSGGKDPATKQLLEQLYGSNVVTNAKLSADYPGANFIVVFGTSQTMPSGSTGSSGGSGTSGTGSSASVGD